MNDAVADGVGKDRIADLFPPAGDVKLRAEYRRRLLVSRLGDFEKIQSQNLAVIGHSHDLLMLYSRSRVSQHFTAYALTVQPLRRDCSVSSDEGVQFSASQLFNPCGRGVQFTATYSKAGNLFPDVFYLNVYLFDKNINKTLINILSVQQL